MEDLDSFKRFVLEGTISFSDSLCCLHDGAMESVDADAFVNFANPTFGFGHFIGSCTQEEIMQMCCPEFNMGMLHLGYLSESEVVVVKGVRRFSLYTGYGSSFKHAGAWSGCPTQSILTMDASTRHHFTEQSVLRDIRKAFLCFQGCHVVSTGKWGCGAFGGVPAHKFAQQLVAATLAGCQLYFSSGSASSEGCDVIFEAVRQGPLNAAQLLQTTLLASAAFLAERREFSASFAEVLHRERARKRSLDAGPKRVKCDDFDP
eukprot:TRINITY_DN17367_c4_g1_i1.p1 TRINITY_DN17367_c4_g1~~TRINITY_DN17367_c4_g1_i1.p1  ORF type:complete len:261 (-),score=43.91 TRINITY_DN17367_c4_g1_i1:536-1318(-)